MRKTQAYAITDVGKIRQINQDYIFFSSEPVGAIPNLYIVADGMGGHKAGDYASKYLVEQLVSYIQESKETQIITILKNGIKVINEQLFHLSQQEESLSGMGTTMVLAVFDQELLYVANVGDSRLYQIRDSIKQITKDHSYVEEMVALGKLKRDSEDYMNKKNIITRAIGSKPDIEVDFFEIDVLPGDYFLLCSDGLTNMVEEHEIESIIRSERSMKEKVELLVARANHHGGQDNIAAILVEPQASEVSTC